MFRVTVFIFSFLSFLVLSTVKSADTDTLQVNVYYESLCKDSQDFITRQLYPVYKEMSGYIDVNLIPFGKATVRNEQGKPQVSCQHGDDECYGNKVQACVINRYKNTDNVMQFVNCAMESDNPASEEMLKQCAIFSGINWKIINSCIKSAEGEKLLLVMAKKTYTLRPTISYVPTIVFDDTYNQELQDKAEDDLQGVLCKLLDDAPHSCKNQSATGDL